MRPLTPDILHWIRDGFPDGIPDAEAPALFSVLSDRVGAERAGDVLRKLQTEGRLSAEAAAALLPGESAQRQVAAKLALGGWPLGGGSADGGDDEAPPREGSALGRIVAWLREGYPGGVPDHDYVPLLASLERRLTRSEVKQVAKALRRADVSPAGPADIAAAISDYTHTTASDDDLRRVRQQLAKKGWPVEFPDPDLP